MVGLEPTSLRRATDFKSVVFANFTTPATMFILNQRNYSLTFSIITSSKPVNIAMNTYIFILILYIGYYKCLKGETP